MIPASRTSIVYNTPSKLLGVPPYYYRLRSCDTNLTSNTPANQYQRLKLIQNTVRVYASLYTSNLGSLSAYQKPGIYGVCWNQMSDRAVPSVQKTVVPSGTNSTLNKRTTSVTSSRPGCQAPGGVGCDIKHNSYDRYLNRLKGRGPLRRGVVPPTFGIPTIPFNAAYPVYGAKTTKTNIVSGCDCLNDNNNSSIINSGIMNSGIMNSGIMNISNSNQIYNNPLYQETKTGFEVGDYVYAIQTGDTYYTRAIIEYKYNDLTYLVQFDDNNSEIQTSNSLLLYYPCNCNGTINLKTYPSGFLVVNFASEDDELYPTYIPDEPVL